MNERTAPISCTEGEKMAWELAARRDNRSFQNWARGVLNAAAIEAGTMLPRPDGGNAVPVVGMEGAK